MPFQGPLHLIHFSPTLTTRRVLRAMAEPFDGAPKEYDLSSPDFDGRDPVTVSSGAAIIGVPVYVGRVPVHAARRLRRISGSSIPAAVVAVYGNRAFEDALVELHDIALAQGFTPAAGAAFIGEHSLATEEAPIAMGRPDDADLALARRFGESFLRLLRDRDAGDPRAALQLPGNRPYREVPEPPRQAPETDTGLCTLCGVCASVCPTGVITVDDAVRTDADGCIRCCACIKRCPERARFLDTEHAVKVRDWLATNFMERREPDLFLP